MAATSVAAGDAGTDAFEQLDRYDFFACTAISVATLS